MCCPPGHLNNQIHTRSGSELQNLPKSETHHSRHIMETDTLLCVHRRSSHRHSAGGAAGQQQGSLLRPSQSHLRMQSARTAAAAVAGAGAAAQQPLEVPADLIDLAHRLADAAAEVTTKYFRQGLLSDPASCWSTTKQHTLPVSFSLADFSESATGLLSRWSPNRTPVQLRRQTGRRRRL